MKVTLRVLDGPLAGQDFAFELEEADEVRIGRDPARCQMVLPEEYPMVSRQHCILQSVLGRVRLRVNKENPVLIGGAQGWDDSVVRHGSELRLGVEGPRLRMSIAADDGYGGPNSTVRVDVGYVPLEQVVQQETQRAAEELRGHRRRVWPAAVLVGAAAAVGIWLAIEARAATGRLVAADFSAEQRRSVLELVGRGAEPKVDLGAVVRTASPSIYCVIDRDADGARPIGTGWVLDHDAGWIATNCHVAEEFVAGRMFLRSLGRQSEDIPVAASRLHPGYQRYAELCGKYTEALKLGGGANSKTVAGCDVALLQVAPEHRALLAPALPLLDRSELRAVGSGLPCASVGFPAEGLAFNVEHPQSRSHIGHVTAVSDFFMAPTSAANAQLVHTDLPVAGGASGSPVLDEHGRVLGIINAGTFTLGMEGRRIPIAGTTYAQRIDILYELLGDDPAPQANRERAWEGAFLAMAGNARKGLEQVLTERFRRAVAGGRVDLPIEVVVREQSTLQWDGTIAKSEFAFKVPAAGRYLFCAMSEDMQDIDAVALLPDGGREVDVSPDWYPCIMVKAQPAETIHFTVLRNVDKPVAASILVLRADG